MSFYVENNGGDFERCPTGVHPARCYRVIDLGTQKSDYMGQPKFLHKIMICWEVHGTDDSGKHFRMKDGRPFAVFSQYTLSWSEKSNLRKMLQSWRGKPFSEAEMQRFDLESILDKWCMVSVIESNKNGKTYTNIDTVTPLPAIYKQNGLPASVNKNEIFSLSEPDMTVFESFTDNLKTKIKSSPEWQKLERSMAAPGTPAAPAPAGVEDDLDDIPF